MAFWIRNTTGGFVNIQDLGSRVAAAEERDLHASFLFESLQQSSDLATLLSGGQLVRLSGPGGSVIPVADAFNDAVAVHAIDSSAHTGNLLTSNVTEGTNLYYTESRVSANSDVSANTSHRGNTSNPHAVTSSQVGLGNVTNDAQLKRQSNDFTTFTEKTIPTIADILLAEDGNTSGNPKVKMLVGNLPFMRYIAHVEETDTVTTTSTGVYVGVKSTFVYMPPAGTYLVFFSGSVTDSSNSSTVFTAIANGTVVSSGSIRRRVTNGDEGSSFVCVAVVTMNGTTPITPVWRVSSGTGSMYERGLTVIKVA